MSKDDGGPAYPSTNAVTIGTSTGTYGTSGHPGMSLRDYFACKAPPLYDCIQLAPAVNSDAMVRMLETTAKWNYAYADCMLAERTKGE